MKWQVKIHTLLDGELPAKEAAIVRAHLEVCSACRSEYVALQHTRQALTSWTTPEVYPRVSATFAARLTAHRARPAFWQRLFGLPWARVAWAGGAVGVLAAVIWLMVAHGPWSPSSVMVRSPKPLEPVAIIAHAGSALAQSATNLPGAHARRAPGIATARRPRPTTPMGIDPASALADNLTEATAGESWTSAPIAFQAPGRKPHNDTVNGGGTNDMQVNQPRDDGTAPIFVAAGPEDAVLSAWSETN